MPPQFAISQTNGKFAIARALPYKLRKTGFIDVAQAFAVQVLTSGGTPVPFTSRKAKGGTISIFSSNPKEALIYALE